jgi:glycine/D-amino acid oxidase-like deaminating enzyme
MQLHQLIGVLTWWGTLRHVLTLQHLSGGQAMADGSGTTEPVRLDLWSGRTVWELTPRPPSPTVKLTASQRADIVIVGAGITGSFLAERLTREGREVLVLDRHEPRTASTAASTALLQWEIDAPMLELESGLGFDAASAIYRRSLAAVAAIDGMVTRLGPGAHLIPRDTLYFAGGELDPVDLAEEHRLRAMAGLPGELLDRAALAGQFGFDRDAAIRSPGSAEADPVALARLALQAAIGRGARVASPVTVVDYAFGFQSAAVRTEDGVEIEANAVILANGYEMPAFVPAEIHRLRSTWAIATAPQPAGALWPDRCLLWEASRPYLYARTTPEDRIIIGGEDEAMSDAAARDAALPGKADALLGKLAELLPGANLSLDAAWAGFFGETEDGLPLIGPVPGQPRCYAAFGYGGNGITFSAMAADLIAAALAGTVDPLTEFFAIDR